jgi:hypothetical protein
LTDDKKFAFRIHALIASLQKLRIFVSHRRRARFCTKDANSEGKFSMLMNTPINLKNSEAIPEKMPWLLADGLDQLRESGCDIGLLWRRIEDAIGLTIILACGVLLQAESEKRPSVGSLCCFQLIGCHVLLDRDVRPYVLEIKIRPSLKLHPRGPRSQVEDAE